MIEENKNKLENVYLINYIKNEKVPRSENDIVALYY